MLQYVNYRMRITILDGRVLVGTLMAFDRHLNLVRVSLEFSTITPVSGTRTFHAFCIPEQVASLPPWRLSYYFQQSSKPSLASKPRPCSSLLITFRAMTHVAQTYPVASCSLGLLLCVGIGGADSSIACQMLYSRYASDICPCSMS